MKKLFSILLTICLVWGAGEARAAATDVQPPIGDIKTKPPKGKPGTATKPETATKPGTAPSTDKDAEKFCQDACTSASCTDPTFHKICEKKCPKEGAGAIGGAGRSCERGWKAKTEGNLKNQQVKNRQGEMVDVKLDSWGDGNAIRSACGKSAKCKDIPYLQTTCRSAFMNLAKEEGDKIAKFMSPDCLPTEIAKALEPSKPAKTQRASEDDIRGKGDLRYEGDIFCLDCDANTCKAEPWGNLCMEKCKTPGTMDNCRKALEGVKKSGELSLTAYQRILSGKCGAKECKNENVRAACKATYEELKEYETDTNVKKVLEKEKKRIGECLNAK